MKKYEKPSIKVIALATSPILAGSADSLNNMHSEGNQLSSEFDFDEDF